MTTEIKDNIRSLEEGHILFIVDNEFLLPPVDVTYLYVT